MMNPASILVFFHPSVRASNDSTNKLRELILESIMYSPHLEDPDYGPRWRQVREAWSNSIHGLTQCEYEMFQVTRTGGRRHQDFSVDYYTESRIVDTKQVEFKFGKTMKGLPQFFSMYDHVQMFPQPYAAF
jgi:hypothetical protein